VVCGSANESARLLLNSKSRLFPTGIGNRYDWVGRNLQGHAYTGAVGLFDFDVYDDLGPGAGIAICDFNHNNNGLIGGGMLANEFIRLPYQFVGWRAPDVPRWGAAHKQHMRQWYRRSMGVMGPVQEMPMFESRVQVDPKVKDAWGIPVVRLSGHRHANDQVVAKFLSSKAGEWLKEAGAIRTWTFLPGTGLSGGQHQAGTCRMGDDPKSSVVDKFCRVHDVENLYVVDGSVHVTNGGFNPVLTIMAIAYYASENLVKSWKSTYG
jgi:choline dehydrogenase-like flavoprotein